MTPVLANEPVVVSSIEPYQPQWYYLDEQEQLKIDLYFFWSSICPHCQRARPFMDTLAQQWPWLTLHSYELTGNQEHVETYIEMASSLNQSANAVPAFIFCEQMHTGFDDEAGTGAFLKQKLKSCYQHYRQQTEPPQLLNLAEEEAEVTKTQAVSPPLKPAAETLPPLQVPGLGTLEPQHFSLPVLTLIIASLDAFNPCAFFVLLFLLSLLVHTRQRSRMLLIGSIFVFFSGLIYFLFMAAWLNVFLYMGELRIVTVIAALIAIIVALINIKDFFWFKQGVSLSIPDQAKPSLYQRIRGLTLSTHLAPLIFSTVILAIVANAYELLCTSGFPMLYTRILTLNELTTHDYYLYLAFYNLIYVIPLMIIVLIFTYTLGSRKLAESEGRALKLVSGLMMLGLGGVLLIVPQWLTQLMVAVTILAVALILSGIIIIWDKSRYQHS
ncbi:MAG: hypothetical protein SVR94_09555 [Pseudomonadota bacterium]|nr:hypothetical protein [Pseudomonadota bacterium]